MVENGATLEYVGAGASHVFARDYDTYLKGGPSAGQTLTVEGTCGSSYAEVVTQEAVTDAGSIVLTSGGCTGEAEINDESSALTVTGSLKAQAGAGTGALFLRGPVVNEGVVEVANGDVLDLYTGSFTNGSGGSVVGVGSGHLLVKGTFVEGAGTTSGSEPVVSENGTVEYVGSGASRVVARHYYTSLKGNLSAGQTLVIEGDCTQEAGVYAVEDVSSAGTIVLTSGGCSRAAYLQAESGKTLTNTGTIEALAGAGGERYLYYAGEVLNEGKVEVADGVALINQATRFVNGSGGSVVGVGSGHLLVKGTFVEGAGTTSGSEPVVSENGTVEYVGSGASRVVARHYYTSLKGNLSAGQTLVVEGDCTQEAGVYAVEDVSSAGTIVLTSGGCSRAAYLEVESGKTLTNTGTIEALAGAGGERYLYYAGEVLNEGKVEVADGVALINQATRFVNGSGGSVVGVGSGHLLVKGTFVEGAGTTSGSEPVVSENGTVEYVGSGASRVVARHYYTSLKGNLSAGQTLVIEGDCTQEAGVYAVEDVSSAGTIVLTSGGCSRAAYLQAESGKTLTNTGTIKVLNGEGGPRILDGKLANIGALAIDAGSKLELSGEYIQGKSGTLRTAIAGPSNLGSLAVSGLAVLGGTLEIEPLAGASKRPRVRNSRLSPTPRTPATSNSRRAARSANRCTTGRSTKQNRSPSKRAKRCPKACLPTARRRASTARPRPARPWS